MRQICDYVIDEGYLPFQRIPNRRCLRQLRDFRSLGSPCTLQSWPVDRLRCRRSSHLFVFFSHDPNILVPMGDLRLPLEFHVYFSKKKMKINKCQLPVDMRHLSVDTEWRCNRSKPIQSMEIYALEMRQLPDFCLPNNRIHPLSRHPTDIWR